MIEGLTPEQNAMMEAALAAKGLLPVSQAINMEVPLPPLNYVVDEEGDPVVSSEPIKSSPGAIQNSGIEVEGKEILVPVMTQEELERNVPPRGKGMVAVKAPEGVSTELFYSLLSNAYALYVTTGSYDADMLIQRTGVSPGILGKILASPEFKYALRLRGVVPNATGLTNEQDYALLSLTNPSDGLTLQKKLKQLGISYSKYLGWMKQPVFKAQMEYLTQGMLHDNMPGMVQLAKLAGEGDLQAIKYQHELNGTYDPHRNQSIDVMALMAKIIEIISIHEKDKTVLSAIAQDMGNIAQTLRIEG